MDINALFPSKYLAAQDIQADPGVVFTIAGIQGETLDGEQRALVKFAEHPKGLILNVTNKNSIVALYGAETDAWIGKRVILFSTHTEFRGEMKPCVRIKPIVPQQMAQPAPAAAPAVQHPNAPAAGPTVPQAPSTFTQAGTAMPDMPPEAPPPMTEYDA